LNQIRKVRKVGRPPLPKGLAKRKIVPVRLSNSEAGKFSKAAKARKQSLSEWIRSTLNAAIAG
jgi:predicted HicB family RNase H-like nuclease